MSKTCSRCKKERPLDHFTSNIKMCLNCKKNCKKSKRKNWIVCMINDANRNEKKKFDNKTITTKKYIENQHKLQNNKCFYCDCEMKYGIGVNRKKNSDGITLERISSKLPHTNSNCVLICQECNKMKNSTEFKDFIEKCTYISNKFKYVFD
jgi:hypothetical protein